MSATKRKTTPVTSNHDLPFDCDHYQRWRDRRAEDAAATADAITKTENAIAAEAMRLSATATAAMNVDLVEHVANIERKIIVAYDALQERLNLNLPSDEGSRAALKGVLTDLSELNDKLDPTIDNIKHVTQKMAGEARDREQRNR